MYVNGRRKNASLARYARSRASQSPWQKARRLVGARGSGCSAYGVVVGKSFRIWSLDEMVKLRSLIPCLASLGTSREGEREEAGWQLHRCMKAVARGQFA